MKTIQILGMVILLTICFSVHATSYFVGTTGNDANTGVTSVSPFKTIQKALDKVIAGDNIYVLAGTYKERLIWKTSGTATALITLTNYNGGIVIVDGGTGGTNTTQNDLLVISNKSYFTISNIQFSNNYRAGAMGIHIMGEGKNQTITGCKIFNIGWTTNAATVPTSGNNANPFVAVGSSANAIKNLTISNNQIYNCITGYSEALTLNGNVDSFKIIGNQVYSITNIGIDIAGRYAWTGAPASVNFARNGFVQDNIVYGCVSLAAPSAGIYVDGGQNIVIERNKSYNNGVGISVGCENAGFGASTILVRDNIVYNNKNAGMYFGSNKATSPVTNSIVSNNTFYKNAISEQWGAEIALQTCTNCKVNQNIIVPNNDVAVAIGIWGYTATGFTADYNLFWRTSSKTTNILASVTVTNTVLGDPKFASAATFDFHLLTGSKAINKGNPAFVAAANELDFDKQARVQVNRIDIGADETSLSQ